MRNTAVATALVLSTVSVTPALAEDDPIVLLDRNAKNAKSFRLDLSTPTAPGFAVIGASPKEIVEPGTLQEFAVHTASFVEDGQINPGIAMNYQPFWLFNSDLTLEEYAGFDLNDKPVEGGLGKLARIFARTQISAATVEGASPKSKTGVRIGLGFHTELLDGPDARNVAAARCYITAYEEHLARDEGKMALRIIKAVNEQTHKDPSADRDAIAAKVAKKEFDAQKTPNYDKALKDCRDAAERRVLEANSWLLGAGAATSSTTKNFDDTRFAGASVWSTFKYPFGSGKALTLFGKADFDQTFDVAGGATASADFYHTALSIALIEQEWKLDATASYHVRDGSRSSLSDEYFQVSLDGAYKLREGAWLEASFGNRSGARFEDDQFGLVQLKLDLSAAASAFTD